MKHECFFISLVDAVSTVAMSSITHQQQQSSGLFINHGVDFDLALEG